MRGWISVLAVALIQAVISPDLVWAKTDHGRHEQPAINQQNGKCEGIREWSDARLHAYWPTEGKVPHSGGLGYVGQEETSREVDLAEARTQVERVIHVSGLEMNFELIVDSSTPAAAAIINGRRVILFDPRFMAQVADRICPDWGAMEILAHEVGHHLGGHTLRQSIDPWRDELEADEFSGFVLSRLGATLAQATSAALRILPEEATPTHPSRKDRIISIVHGWQNAQALLSSELTQAKHNPGLVPMRQTRYDPDGEGETLSDLALLARIILYDDPNDYYITKGGRIDTYNGKRRGVGHKSLPTSPDYAWAFQADATRFDVDFAGHILMRLPSGVMHEVGVVVALIPEDQGGN